MLILCPGWLGDAPVMGWLEPTGCYKKKAARYFYSIQYPSPCLQIASLGPRKGQTPQSRFFQSALKGGLGWAVGTSVSVTMEPPVTTSVGPVPAAQAGEEPSVSTVST